MHNPILPLDQDHHVHSDYSDGRGSLDENIDAARRAGLSHLGCVDHVRASTTWVPVYAAHVAALRRTSPLELTCGVEAKILDLDGHLDLPTRLEGVDRIVAADHQVPGPSGPLHPDLVRTAIAEGRIRGASVVEAVVTATEAAMRRYAGLQLAHLFSILPKVGLSEDEVRDDQLHRLAEAAWTSGAVLEVSERWRCPDRRVVRIFFDAGVRVVASTDAHAPDAVGRYTYVADVARPARTAIDRKVA